MDATPLRICFEKIDRFIKIYDGIRYLVLFGSRRYDAVFDRIRYPVSKKSSITDIISHSFVRIKIDSYSSLPIEKVIRIL